MPPRFGTDGIRGVANKDLTPEFALAVGRAAARVLGKGAYLVGRDTRLSGTMLEAALSAGLASEGCDVIDLGVIPTPGVAFLAADRGLKAAMISASHNPFQDNGIKLFGAGGTKLSLEAEAAMEQALESICSGAESHLGAGELVGLVSSDPGGAHEYAEHLCQVVGASPLGAGEVVVDCANGAASGLAPEVLGRLGVDFHLIHAEPEGTNINRACGSTDLGPLKAEVTARKAALGVAFDGDADRMLAVDENGRMIDGDQLIAMFASDLHKAGRLRGDSVVVTVLSNLGLRIGLTSVGVSVLETPVGDRHVADALEAGGYVLGGEQSGHLIFREHASTGDGILTALKLLELLGRTGRPLSELADEAMSRLPQVLVNVPVREPQRLEGAKGVWAEAEKVEAELGEAGRVLLRPSGTESCVRVMVEAPTHDSAERLAGQIAAAVIEELG